MDRPRARPEPPTPHRSGPIRRTIPTTSPRSTTANLCAYRTARPAIPGRSSGPASSRRSGTRRTMGHSDIVAKGRDPNVFVAGSVIVRTGPAVRKTPILPAFQRATSSNKWLSTRGHAGHQRFESFAALSDDRPFQADYRCRGGSGGGLFLCPEATQAHQGSRERHGAEKLHRWSGLGSDGER